MERTASKDGKERQRRLLTNLAHIWESLRQHGNYFGEQNMEISLGIGGRVSEIAGEKRSAKKAERF
jgi:hypothetical protein